VVGRELRRTIAQHGPDSVAAISSARATNEENYLLRPAVRSDKGDAIRRIIGESNADSVIVAGDDLGDLSAFAAAFELKARGGDVLRVAVDSAEAPPVLIEQADVIVDGPAGLLEFLRRLLV
jgi:trehalose 6-phosphate phosphatase